MATFYFAANGNDKNDGLSPETAWQTTKDFANRVPGGSTVLFRRGDRFYGAFTIPSGVDDRHKTVLSAYGEGDKPQICEYKIAKGESSWEEYQPHIWRLDLTDPEKYYGNTFTDSANVGYILAEGAIQGFRYEKVEDISIRRWWDFACDDRYVYVACNRNPSEYGEVCFAVGGGIHLGDHCLVENLDVFGGGCHGMNGGVHHTTVRNCDVHDFGGARLTSIKDRFVRFGNGIEFWSEGEDILVEDCKIYNIYDVGVTMQGFAEKDKGWKNVVYRHNIFWGNQQTFEIWTKNAKSDEGMTDCRFERNICIGSGCGWSYYPRPDKNAGSHLLLYPTNAGKHDITVEGNVFYGTRRVLYHKAFDPWKSPKGEVPPEYVTKNNHIFMGKNQYLMDMKHTYRASELAAMQAELSLECGSTMHYIEPTDGYDVPAVIAAVSSLVEK